MVSVGLRNLRWSPVVCGGLRWSPWVSVVSGGLRWSTMVSVGLRSTAPTTLVNNIVNHLVIVG